MCVATCTGTHEGVPADLGSDDIADCRKKVNIAQLWSGMVAPRGRMVSMLLLVAAALDLLVRNIAATIMLFYCVGACT